MVEDEFSAVGTPEQVSEKLHLFNSRYGPQAFNCWFNTGGMLTHERVAESMRLFASEVIPRFRD